MRDLTVRTCGRYSSHNERLHDFRVDKVAGKRLPFPFSHSATSLVTD